MQGVRQYRKCPVVVSAVQWAGANLREVREFLGDDYVGVNFSSEMLQVRTLEGVVSAKVGDYLIRGVAGEHYPCDERIFEATYDMVGVTA